MGTNTTSNEYKIECLARHLLSEMTLQQRRAFLKRYKGDGDEIRAELIKQHAKRLKLVEAALQTQGKPPLSDHEQRKSDLASNRASYAVLAADDVKAALADRPS